MCFVVHWHTCSLSKLALSNKGLLAHTGKPNWLSTWASLVCSPDWQALPAQALAMHPKSSRNWCHAAVKTFVIVSSAPNWVSRLLDWGLLAPNRPSPPPLEVCWHQINLHCHHINLCCYKFELRCVDELSFCVRQGKNRQENGHSWRWVNRDVVLDVQCAEIMACRMALEAASANVWWGSSLRQIILPLLVP